MQNTRCFDHGTVIVNGWCEVMVGGGRHEACDCACHPWNGLVAEQRRYQFGTLELAGREQPCWCCWCHYSTDDNPPETNLMDLCG